MHWGRYSQGNIDAQQDQLIYNVIISQINLVRTVIFSKNVHLLAF